MCFSQQVGRVEPDLEVAKALVAALLAEAIEDALTPFGDRIAEMPLSPTRLWELISEASARSSLSQTSAP